MMNVTVLGCGSSSGVPLIGCTCPVCASDNPKNKRTRVSIAVQSGDTRVLVDTSPDLRAQCLREGITRVDALIFTHAHADHLHGVDDMRSFNYLRGTTIDTYASEETLRQIHERFGYVFLPPKPTTTQGDLIWLRPCLTPITVKPYEPFKAGGIDVLPFTQKHGGSATLGLRFGNFAYSTDVNGLPEESLAALEGVDTWIVDCLRYEPSPTHAHLEMTLEWIRRVKPRRAYLTHLNHGFDYDTLAQELPEGVFPAYDGLKLEM
jgi:phosphoribosyl 1,2-cyclic phosphate phosphodiesterase